jgi:hypothetical protein
MEQKPKDSRRYITPSGAGLAAICFFLPWFRACGQDVSGSQIASNGESLLWLVLIAAIAIVGGFFMYDEQNNLKKLKPIVIGGAILSLLILLIKYAQLRNQGNGMFEGVFELRYGSFGSLIGFIATLFGLQFLEDSIPISTNIFCTECGVKSLTGSAYCSECGAKIE